LVFIGFFMFLIPFCLIHLSLDLVFMNLAHKHWEKAFVNIDKVENSAKYLAFLKTQEPKLALLYFNKTSPLILILACIHAIFMLGALYFQRVSYVKTIIFLFVLGLFLFVFNFSIDKLLYSNEVEYTNTTSTTEMGTLRNNIRNIWLYFAYFIPLILWGIAYIRLKEKEE
jgi:hypothetical protein